MSIAITGASGHLGRQVADLLLDRVDPAQLVLLTRTPDTLDAYAQRGATVRQADFHDPAGLAAALDGVERMLLISTDVIEGRGPLQVGAVQAAVKAGVGHIVYTSLPRAEGHPALVGPSHAETEAAIGDSGVAWTFLRNNLYAEFQIPVAANAAATGQLVTNAGDGRVAYVARTDCAAAAAAVLAAGDQHANRAYDITGPAALGAADVAAIASELSGKPVEVVQVDDDAYVAGMVEHAGIPEAGAKVIASFGRAQREGWLDAVSTSVADITGNEPRSLRDVIAEGWEAATA